MKIITKTKLISGGNPAVAAGAAAAAAVITGTAAIIQSFDTITTFGEKLGEKVYDHKHPDSGLGKMEYTKADFQQPNWYTGHHHPNNSNSNSFHGSFGNF